MQEQINHARELIQQKRYHEARQILSRLDHPKRDEWLARIAELEREQRAPAAPPPAAPAAKRSTASTRRAKPLPLLPEEERRLLPGGQPINPQEILRSQVGVRGRARAMMYLYGAKTGPLVNNFWRMKKRGLAVVFLLIYLVWFIAWFPAFGVLFVLGQRLFTTGTTHFPVLIIGALVVAGLPFYPNLIAWVQQEMYDQWVRDFAQLRQDYFDGKLG